MKSLPLHTRLKKRGRAAFSLIEVLVAMAIFFLCIFGILELTSRSLRAARAIQKTAPNAGMLAAWVSTYTNRLEEGVEEGDFDDYPDYSWRRDIVVAGTNGFFRVDFWVQSKSGPVSAEPNLSIYLHRPLSVGRGGATR